MKIVFFDAEGTLYTAKKGKQFQDFWEGGEHTLKRAIEFFQLNKGVKGVLEELSKRKIAMAVVSIHKEHILLNLLKHFGIGDYFEEVMTNDDKGRLITSYLSRVGIRKENALMIGDKYEIDIEPVIRVGVKALQIGKDIQSFSDILDHLDT